LSEQPTAVRIRARGMISNGLLVEAVSVYVSQMGQIDRLCWLVGPVTVSACIVAWSE